MTVPSTTRKAGPLLGNGVQTSFPFTFKVFAADDVAVTIANSLGVETGLVLDTDYTVTLNANQETSPGGSVTYPISGTALPTGSRLTIFGDLDYDQPLDLPTGGNFSPVALENQLDRMVIQIQQLREILGRAVQVSVSTGANVGLPAPAANALIGWDSTAQDLQNFPLSDIATALAFATFRYDVFTGDAAEDIFPLTVNPTTLGNLDVSVDGLTVVPGLDYTLVAGNLMFTTPPADGAEILARYGEALPPGASADALDVSYQPAGTGAVATTVQNKLRESLSVKDFSAVGDGVTDDTAEIQAAVTAAIAADADLYWPAGDYLTTASVTNFHTVRHVGAGVVVRGSDSFHVQPVEGQTNRLYIATTGSATNDGLSSSQPFNTFQNCFDATENYGPVLAGTWELIAAAGTYTISSGQQTFSTPSKNRVLIRGPVAGHPNVPTCIVDGGGVGTQYNHGLSASGPGVVVEFRDIKAQNFTEASGFTRIGVLGQNRCDFLTTNIHTEDCSWTGIYATVTERARIGGGILDGGGVGAYGVIIDTTEATVGYLGGLAANRPIIRNAISAGIYWSTGSQGHADFCDVEDNGVGFFIAENSRCDTVNLDFKRNTVAIRAATGGVWGEGGALNVYNQGTADANGTVFQAYAFSGNITELNFAQSGSYIRVAYDRTTRTASGTGAYSFPTIYTLKGYRLQGAGKSMRVHVKGIYTVTGGTTVIVNIGGMAVSFTVPAAGSGVAFEVDMELMEVAGGYRAIGRLSAGLNATRFTTATAGFDNTVDSAVSVSGNLVGAGDSINLYRTDVYLLG